MNRPLRWFTVALLFFVAHPVFSADPTPKTVRLLTVGNSFSQNAVHYLGDLAKATGDTLVLRGDNIGGGTMAQHWTRAELHDKDPSDPAGTYSGRGLKEDLAADKWDFVTIQQASIASHNVATYRPYAAQLRDYIKKYAPQAEILLHQTWEYRRDDSRFKNSTPKDGEPATQDAMYQGLSSAYQTIAKELEVRRIPVGDAFHLADNDPKWSYQPDTKFDRATAQPPALPDQTHSLHVGWKWTKGKDGMNTLGMDGHHANLAGEYLGACVFYEILFAADVTNNTFVPKGLDADYAHFLRATAHRAVLDSRNAK